MAYALKYLWNMINIVQFGVFIGKWKLSFSNYGLKFLNRIKILVLMEFLPTDEFIDWISEKLGISQDCEECDVDDVDSRRRLLDEVKSDGNDTDTSSALERSNISTERIIGGKNLLKNMGVMFALGACIILFIVVFISIRCLVKGSETCYKIYMTIQEKMFYNLFIRYFLQSTLKL